MNDSNPLLKQIPLTSTLYPPQPVRLSYNYAPLPPSLPPTQVNEDSLRAWITECEHVKSSLEIYGQRETAEYDKWQQSMRRVAPGYMNHGLLTPLKKAGEPDTPGSLDKQFEGLDIK